MGKSLGNFINLEQFFTGKHEKLEKAFDPMTIRFFILQAHYRSTLDFGNDALKAAEKGLTKLSDAVKTLNSLSPSNKSSFDVRELEKKCFDALNDDFNTPILIAHLFEGVKQINLAKNNKAEFKQEDLEILKSIFKVFANNVLGLTTKQENSSNDFTNEIMEIILKLRNHVKTNKDFVTADLIRDELDKVGIQIKDTREGSSWESKS